MSTTYKRHFQLNITTILIILYRSFLKTIKLFQKCHSFHLDFKVQQIDDSTGLSKYWFWFKDLTISSLLQITGTMYQLSLKRFKSVGIDCHLVSDSFLVLQFHIHEAIDIFHCTQKTTTCNLEKEVVCYIKQKYIQKKLKN